MVDRRIIFFSVAVEGDIDAIVIKKIIQENGGNIGTVHGKQGKAFIKKRIPGYNRDAHFHPWIVLIDLDHDADCAPPVRTNWVPDVAQYMCFRIAVHEIESWLLADRERVASYLRLPIGRIPDNPDSVHYPKKLMVELAELSRSSEIRMDMVPRRASGRNVGPAYTSRLIDYITNHWRSDEAAKVSESLNRSIRRIKELINTTQRFAN